MHTAIFLYCYNAWYDYIHMQNKNETLWMRVMQRMSPNHEYTIIFVFDLAKSIRFFFSFSYENIWTKLYARLPRARHYIFPWSHSLIIHENYITLPSHLYLSLIVIFMRYSILILIFWQKRTEIQLILPFMGSVWPI